MPLMTLALTAALLGAPDWTPCGENVKEQPLQCATIQVPLDHRKPNGRTIKIGMTRMGEGKKVLFVNGGGPGITGDSLLRGPYSPVPPKVAAKRTVVAIDPRGLPKGKPLGCLTPAAVKRITGAISSPPTRKGMRTMARIGRTCQNRYMGSVANAYDMDFVRKAMGQRKLDYVGVSYGTYLGATYSHLFPQRVGRMVLGGVVHPDRTWTELLQMQVAGFEKAINRWARDCHDRPTCPFPRRDPLRGLTGLIADLNQSPRPQVYGNYSGQTLILNLRDDVFYGSSWKQLDETVSRAKDLPASELSTGLLEAMTAVQWATRCTDWPDPEEGMRGWRERQERWGRKYPVFGAGLSPLAVPCTTWPGRPRQSLPLTQTTRAVPLLVSGLHDPATPLAGAKAMQRLFGDAQLVTWKGRGHGALESGDCNKVTSAYLLHGEFVAKRCS